VARVALVAVTVIAAASLTALWLTPAPAGYPVPRAPSLTMGSQAVQAAAPRRVRPVLPLPGERGPRRPTVAQWRRGQHGFATYYAGWFDGRVTASGVRFDNDALFAAHPFYPFGTVLRVTNLRNGRSVQVRVVDRGPARGPRASGVVIDLSRAAARALDFIEAGRVRVRLEILRSGDSAAGRRTAAAATPSAGTAPSRAAGSQG
jgi:rare lipoprotein A